MDNTVPIGLNVTKCFLPSAWTISSSSHFSELAAYTSAVKAHFSTSARDCAMGFPISNVAISAYLLLFFLITEASFSMYFPRSEIERDFHAENDLFAFFAFDDICSLESVSCSPITSSVEGFVVVNFMKC